MAPESKSTGQDLRATSASGRSEAELVVAAERGEAGAFEELVVMTQDRLYNLTFRMTGQTPFPTPTSALLPRWPTV